MCHGRGTPRLHTVKKLIQKGLERFQRMDMMTKKVFFMLDKITPYNRTFVLLQSLPFIWAEGTSRYANKSKVSLP